MFDYVYFLKIICCVVCSVKVLCVRVKCLFFLVMIFVFCSVLFCLFFFPKLFPITASLFSKISFLFFSSG